MNTVSFINPRAQEAPAIPDPSLGINAKNLFVIFAAKLEKKR